MNFFQTVYNVLLKFDFEPFFWQWCCVNEPINTPTSNEHLFAMVSHFISINDKLNDFFLLENFLHVNKYSINSIFFSIGMLFYLIKKWLIIQNLLWKSDLIYYTKLLLFWSDYFFENKKNMLINCFGRISLWNNFFQQK